MKYYNLTTLPYNFRDESIKNFGADNEDENFMKECILFKVQRLRLFMYISIIKIERQPTKLTCSRVRDESVDNLSANT